MSDLGHVLVLAGGVSFEREVSLSSGRRVADALVQLGVWDAVSPRVVYGSNIKETMQLAETGNADVALIAKALAVKAGGRAVDVPESLHPPIEQAMVACKGGGHEAEARRFVAFMASPAVRELLAGYGFAPPGG